MKSSTAHYYGVLSDALSETANYVEESSAKFKVFYIKSIKVINYLDKALSTDTSYEKDVKDSLVDSLKQCSKNLAHLLVKDTSSGINSYGIVEFMKI